MSVSHEAYPVAEGIHRGAAMAKTSALQVILTTTEQSGSCGRYWKHSMSKLVTNSVAMSIVS
jgi:hypothetical protein